MGHDFALDAHHTYSRFFSEALDTLLNVGMASLGKGGSAKGVVVTGADVARHRQAFRAYSLLYPCVAGLAGLDALVPWASGYMLIATATRRPTP